MKSSLTNGYSYYQAIFAPRVTHLAQIPVACLGSLSHSLFDYDLYRKTMKSLTLLSHLVSQGQHGLALLYVKLASGTVVGEMS